MYLPMLINSTQQLLRIIKYEKIIGFTKEALEAYFSRQWEKAIMMFGELSKIDGNKVFAKMFIERCRDLSQAPPQDGWDGVWQMTKK